MERPRTAGGIVGRVAAPAALVLAAATLAAACSNGQEDRAEGGGGDRPTEFDERSGQVAETVCGTLRRWHNELAVPMNATSDTITDADDPETANQVLLEGLDGLIVVSEAHQAEATELELPEFNERTDMLEQLATGAEEATQVLRERRDEVAALDPITVDDQSRVLGGAMLTLERAVSAVEPDLTTYPDVLKAAFEGTPDCDNVIQPFR